MLKNSAVALSAPGTNIAEFANSVDPDDAAHNELPYQDLHCFSYRL